MTFKERIGKQLSRLRTKENPWTALMLLFLVSLFSYGWMLTSLGFYWDDWPKAWFLHLLGPSGFHSVYAVDRPILAYTYLLTTPILGESPLPWHLFALLCTWGSAVAVWLLVRTVWPRQSLLAVGAGLLYLTYPGFTQQSIALIYSHYFLILATFLLSLILMVRAARSSTRRVLHLGLAIALAAYCHFSIEYFIGLEILRPLLLWWVLEGEALRGRKHLRTVLSYFLPFLIIDLGFLAWRVWVIQFPTYTPQLLDQLLMEPLQALGSLLQMISKDLYTVSLSAWSQALHVADFFQVGPRGLVFSLEAIFLGAGSVVVYWLIFVNGRKSTTNSGGLAPDRRLHQVLLAGAVALLGAGWPFWITGLPIELEFPKDRFTLPMIFGTSLMITGIVFWFFRKAKLRLLLLALLVGFGAGRQVLYTNEYRIAWETQRRFFWQMSWRIPDLQPGTTIVTHDFPSQYYSDNSLTAPLNWIYAPDLNSTEMPYMLYFISVRVGLGLPRLEEGLPIHQDYRATTFDGSTSQILVLMYQPPGCLHVLDAVLDDGLTGTPDGITAAIPLSDLGLINLSTQTPKQPPKQVFGEEPDHTWCYYYQKADLARQRQAWLEIVELGEVAFELSDRPNNASERLPFIEGYAHTGDWERAVDLSRAVLTAQPQMSRLVCNTWKRLLEQTQGSDSRQFAAEEIKSAAGCDTW